MALLPSYMMHITLLYHALPQLLDQQCLTAGGVNKLHCTVGALDIHLDSTQISSLLFAVLSKHAKEYFFIVSC